MNEIQMRQFYQTFPKRDTLRPEWTWSHYRRLISVENEVARLWYHDVINAMMKKSNLEWFGLIDTHFIKMRLNSKFGMETKLQKTLFGD